MQLSSINIKNYRSLEDLTLEITSLDDGSFSYGLIGVNEAGKSSILKAIAIKDDLIKLTPKDFKDKSKSVEINFNYQLSRKEVENYKVYVSQKYPSISTDATNFQKVTVFYIYTTSNLNGEIGLKFELNDGSDSVTYPVDEEFFKDIHEAIFWTAEEKYLISKPINLAAFSSKPQEVSVPLRNCFLLADIPNISERIKNIADDSTEIEELQTQLGESVTKHIKEIWPNHPIEITFIISSGQINFHVKDKGSNKPKTAEQRSDGFKQFISFLLTISAQNMNEELSNSILLLDEPETHLHPQAQEFLLGEINKITRNKRNNVALFATHSNYMIDKIDLSRNYRVEKVQDKTKIERLNKNGSTYASVNYQVFGIVGTDYFSELYGKLHEKYIDSAADDAGKKERSYQNNFDTKYLVDFKGLKKIKPFKGNPNSATFPTYIRNCIHHPENGDKFTAQELENAIKLLESYLETYE